MTDVNNWAVLAATVAAVVAALAYYVAFGRQLVELGSASSDASPSPWLLPIELLRALVVVVVVAVLIARLGITVVGGAAILGLGLWVAFPVVLLAGSVIHENVPARLAAIHAGEWLLKLLLISIIVTLWQ